LFGEAEQQQAAALLQARALCAPQLVDYEIANVAVKKLRRERLAESAVLACLDAYAALDLQRHAVEVGPVLVLAQRYQLTAYDAAYLWLAEQLRRWRLLIRSSPRLRRSTWPGGLIRRCPEDDFS
jgi:predicted nucleic acid-binding protein